MTKKNRKPSSPPGSRSGSAGHEDSEDALDLAVRTGLGTPDFDSPHAAARRGLGPEAGGQSGDTGGLSRDELSGPESVEELIEEGQAFEASIVDGVENAPNADQGPVRTRQVPEDDVPQEYLDED